VSETALIPRGTPPYVSICVLSYDADQGSLPKLLDSIICRPKGSAADEIVIYWSGTGAGPPSLSEYAVPDGVSLRVIVGPWKADDPSNGEPFAWARQLSFEAARGVWRGYLDSDDVLGGAFDRATDAALKRSGTSAVAADHGQTLQDYLRDLPPEVNGVCLPYLYREDEVGNPDQISWRARFVRWADGWVWKAPVHEDMHPLPGNIARPRFNAGLVVIHGPTKPDMERVERNLAILMRLYEQVGDRADYRTLYGIGSALLDRGDVKKARDFFARALSAGPSPEDAWHAHRLLARACMLDHVPDAALHHAMMALAILPDRPDSFIGVAEVMVRQGQLAQAIPFFEMGFARAQPDLFLMDEPSFRLGFMRAGLAESYLAVGRVDDAVRTAEEAVKATNNPYPATILRVAREQQRRTHLAMALQTLVSASLELGDVAVASAHLDACPVEIEGLPSVRVLATLVSAAEAKIAALQTDEVTLGTSPDAALRNAENDAGPGGTVSLAVPDAGQARGSAAPTTRVRWNAERLFRRLQQRGRVEELIQSTSVDPHDPQPYLEARYVVGGKPNKGRVAIICPHYVEPWGPYTADQRGIGGSEEAVIYLAPALARLGYDVEVYGPTPGEMHPLHVHESVVWRPIRAFNPGVGVDHLIALRAPEAVLMRSTAGFDKPIWIWHHDHAYPAEQWGPGVVRRARHLYVSQWQRDVLEAQAGLLSVGAVIGNGVPPEQILAAKEGAGRRDRYRCIWASMPTRRLDRLVDIWPEVKRRWARATLDIYYGMHTVAQLWRNRDPATLEKMYSLRAQAEALRPYGVTWRGRVGHAALTKEMWGAGVLPYPSDFPETFMIAATRAASCGVIPVVLNSGSLHETSPVEPVPGPIDDAGWAGETRSAWLDALGRAFAATAEDRGVLSDRTLKERSWDVVAGRLAAVLKEADVDNVTGLLAPQPQKEGVVVPPRYSEPQIIEMA